MAANNFDAFVPEITSSKSVLAVSAQSQVWAHGNRHVMPSAVLEVPRYGIMGAAVGSKGSAYTQDTATNDVVTLTARKWERLVTFAEEDLHDVGAAQNMIEKAKINWATSLGKAFDNACIGTTAAANGTTVPYTSLYKLLTTTDATLGYTANDNVTTSATATAVTYTNLRDAARKYEEGAFFDFDNTIVIASPAFKDILRSILDTTNQPIFRETGVVDPVTGRTRMELFGYPLVWSNGARATATATAAPGSTTNRLLIFANKEYLLTGESWPLASKLTQDVTSDNVNLMMHFRAGFAGAHPAAFSILDDVV